MMESYFQFAVVKVYILQGHGVEFLYDIIFHIEANSALCRIYIICQLNLCMLGSFHLIMLSADIFQHHFFQNILSGITSEYQPAWIHIRPNILSGLIWVQSVRKGYQQMTQLAASRQRGKTMNIIVVNIIER